MKMDESRQRLLRQMIGQPPATATVSATDSPRVELASFAQRRLWFIEQLQQVQAPYTLHAVQHLRFAVDRRLLEEALREIVRRHEVLRTTFEMIDDEVVQRIQARPAIALDGIDLRAIPAPQREREAKQRMAQMLAQRFDLRRGPLLRAELYQMSGEEFLLLLAVHHIVFDWQSFQVFFQELDALYAAGMAGRMHGLPPVAEQYAAFAREQREQLIPARIEAEAAFWRTELARLPMLDLPLDRQRPGVPTFRGDQITLALPAALVQRLEQRAVAAQTTLFTVLLAGLAAALGRVCHQQDFALGLPFTGRDSQARQQAIGFFVDTLAVRLRWSDDPSADELLLQVREAMRRALMHRQLPFELLVQHLQIARDLGVNPVFQVGFQLMQQPMLRADSDGTVPARLSAMFDLCIDLWPQDGALRGRLQFNADIFDAPTIDLLGQAFAVALHWLAQPGQRLSELAFDSLALALPASLLAGESMTLDEQTCLDLMTEVTQREPDATAIEDANGQLSYRALMERIDSLAGVLAARGVAPGSIVVIELQRSLDLVLAQLAVMRAGAAFTCLDPEWPSERRMAMRTRTGTPLVINTDALPDLLCDSGSRPPARWPGPRDMAYVICTSGSTGEPKGVMIEHLGLLNVAHAQRRLFGLGKGRRVGQLAAPTFDASVFELILALCSGATLVISPPGIVVGETLHNFLTRSAVDTVVVPPSVLATCLPERCASLRLVCVAGESCPADLAERFGAGREFWNLYGPTETTIWATAGRVVVGAKVSIGKPIPNLCTVVLDEHGRVVPVGMAGELCIAGAGLARGYLQEPALTSRAFVPVTDALGGLGAVTAMGYGRVYHTGDLVRQLRSGELIFLGRTDRQLKVRGLRIEPEEIERVLRTHLEVTEVLVDAAEVHGEQVLVAYLQARPGRTAMLFEACRARLRARLPAYMCPSHFVALAEMPRTSSGKIDRRALPSPVSDDTTPLPPLAPATETERVVTELMQQLLHRPRVRADDDFFLIGGHSLAAVQLAARVKASFGVELSIAEVFAHSKVSSLAVHIDAIRSIPLSERLDEVPLVRLPREQAIP